MNFDKVLQDLLDFATLYPNKWHSYAQDQLTQGAVNWCVTHGLLIINEYDQFYCTLN